MTEVGSFPRHEFRENPDRPIIIAVVPNGEVRNTGTVSSEFAIAAGVPEAMRDGKHYGYIRRESVDFYTGGDEDFSKKVFGGQRRVWHCYVSRSDGNERFESVVDATVLQNPIERLLENAPDCVVLVEREDIEELAIVSTADMRVFQHDGPLATSGE